MKLVCPPSICRKNPLVPLAVATSLVLACSLSAIAQVNYRVLAVSGDPIETRRGSEARLGSFADPAINNLNQVAFRGIVYGRGINNTNNDSIILQRLFRRTASVVASEGQIITAGYLGSGVQSPTTSTSTPATPAAGQTTTVETFDVVLNSRLGTENGASTFGSRVALSPEGVVVFPSTTTVQTGRQTITTVVDDATGDIISQNGEFVETPQSPATLFATDGRTPTSLITVNTPATAGQASLGPTGLSSFGSGQFSALANGRVVLSGSFFDNAPNATPVTGEASLDILGAMDGGLASLSTIVVQGDTVPGLPINNSPTYGTTEAGIAITTTTLPAMNVGNISSMFLSTDSQTVDDVFGVGSGDSNRFRGIWNFSEDESLPAFFVGRGSAVLNANSEPVGLLSVFGGVNTARGSEPLPLTVAGSTNGFICFTGQMIDNDGILQPQSVFFSRILPDGRNFRGLPGELGGPGPNADKQLPYLPNGVAFQSVAVNTEVLVQTAFPNGSRNQQARAPLASIAQVGINSRGTIIFQGSVVLASGALVPVNGIWAIPFGARQPGNREPVCIALEGDIITINRKARKVVAIRFNPYNGLNDANRLVYTVSFDDATSAVMFANIQQNTGYIDSVASVTPPPTPPVP